MMCEMSQKRPLIRSTLVLAFERGKEEEEFKEKEDKKKINALRLSSIIFVVALVYVVVYVVVVNSLIEDIIEKNFAYSFSCLTSLKKKRGNLSVLEQKKGENTNNLFWDSTTTKRIIILHVTNL
jgi:flagellar basal body-associated protein FliL